MADLVNAQTSTVQDVPQDQVNEALNSGTHTLIKGQPFNIVDPEGNLISLPSEQVPEALKSGYQIPAQSHITEYSNQQKYGEGLANEAKAFGAGAARGATFGASDVALPALGVTSQEALRERAARNPVASTAGELTGAVGMGLAAPELGPVAGATRLGEAATEAIAPVASRVASSLANPETSPIVAKILSRVGETGAKTLGSAVEAMPYGVGQQISETALGNEDFNAENLLHNVGYAALYGGALGSVLGVGKAAFGKEVEEAAIKDALLDNLAHHPDSAVPTSLEEMQKHIEAAKKEGISIDLPSKATAIEDSTTLADEDVLPMLPYEVQALESPLNRKAIKTIEEAPGEAGKIMRDWQAVRKAQLVDVIDSKIEGIAPNTTLSTDATKNGKNLIDRVWKNFTTERDALKPLFDKFDTMAIDSLDQPHDLLAIIKDAIPDAEKYIVVSEDGLRKLSPFSDEMGFSKDAHDAISGLFKVFNKPETTIKELRNLREAWRSKINFLSDARASAEISRLRSGAMDIIQNRIEQLAPDFNTRELFKRYAINEKMRDNFQKLFKGKFDTRGELFGGIKAEDVLDNIFRDTERVNAAKTLLGKDFPEAVANWLKQAKAHVTDKASNGFSSAKFDTFLRNNRDILNEALALHPEEYKKIGAATRLAKILPDAPSGNPSGTATTTLLQKAMKLGTYITPEGLTKIPSDLLKYFTDTWHGAQQRKAIDEVIAGKRSLTDYVQNISGKQNQYNAYSKIERFANQTRTSIQKQVSPLFGKIEGPVKGIAAQKLTPEDQIKKFDKLAGHLKELTGNPTKMIESLHAASAPLTHIAPRTAQSLNTTLSRATQFLASKLPAQDAPSPFMKPYQPSSTEIAKFNRYREVVEKPLSVLKQLQSGTLTAEAMEALKTVHPEHYAMIRDEIMSQIGKQGTLESMPYPTKLVLSAFLDSDLTNTLKPQNIIASQLASQPPAPPPGTPGKKTNQKGLEKLNRSAQFLTPFQKSSQRIE